ncbi:unnamed protein product [Pedinophyceae sp. YPF-701]|nr:unnamed protein product [Pedinophyceae sp. YPF-701]
MPTEKAALGLALQRLHEANAFQVRGQVFINNVVGFAMVGFEKFDRATEAGEKAYRTMLRSLAQDLLVWEGHLAAAGEGGFAGGSAFTLADCVLAPPLFFVERCGGDFSGLPALSGYMRRLAERPSVQETVPENWKAPPGGVWATIFEDVAAAVAAEKEGAGGAAE